MKTASAWVTFERHGSNIHKGGLTPAEVQVLVVIHHKTVGKVPVHDLVEDKTEVPRTENDELNRLCSKYGRELVTGLFGKINPRFPKTFKDALSIPDISEPAVEEPTKKD